MSAGSPSGLSDSNAQSSDGLSDPILAPILLSRPFQRATTSQRLLHYLWTRRESTINEYAIGVDALGKRPDFDPRIDAAVRVQMSRLRQRLTEYYENEGAALPERLELPPGSYRIRLVHVEAVPSTQEPVAPKAPSRALLVGLSSACAVLLVATISLSWALRTATRSAAPAEPAPRLWRDFFASGRPTRVIVPAPVFFDFPSSGFRARDIEINDFADLSKSPALSNLAKQFGAPRLIQDYTVTSDTFASVRLAQYLQKRGWDVPINSTSDTPLETLDRENLILLGTAYTLHPYRDKLQGMTLELAPQSKQLVLDHGPGKPSRYEEQRITDQRAKHPAIMALLPGRAPGSDVLVLESSRTAGLVYLLTSSQSESAWEQLWIKAGRPRYWESLVYLDHDSTTLLQVEPRFVRPLALRK